jgi:PAS domain S-box-containing protein
VLTHLEGEMAKESEAKYRGLLEAVPDAIVVVNQGGNIVLLNLQAEKQFGYHRDELVGQKLTSIIPEGFAERLIADGLRSAEEARSQQMGTGIELVGRRKDGSQFPIKLLLSPLESAEGLLVTAAIRDISVRKDAEKYQAEMDRKRRGVEEALRQSEQQYRMLLDGIQDYAVFMIDPQGQIVSWNAGAERIKGYKADEIIGRNFSCFFPPEEVERGRPEEVLRMTAAKGRHEEQGMRVRKDGTRFLGSVTFTALRDPAGHLRGFSEFSHDLSKAEANLRQNVEDLKRSNEELAQFAYIASHDLQEPLRMVASYTQLLSRRYKGKLDSDADEFIAFAVDGANRMQRLIQDLLVYSRVGTKGGEQVDTSSEQALQHALTNLQDAIREGGAQVTHDPLPTVLADESQLIQLFQNLVGNAIKYQGPGVPRVHISAARNGDEKWTFSVKDNGLGIDPKYFERIFGMFQRLHKRDEFAGTGIGLAICKKIVERHGGRISVESQPGQGSTFRFALANGRKS